MCSYVSASADVVGSPPNMKIVASWLYEFITYVVVIEQIIWMLGSIIFQSILLKACIATSYPTCWPGKSCKSPAFSSERCLLKVFITAQPRVLLITSLIPIGLTPAFLSKRKILHAKVSSDPFYPQYLFKYLFSIISLLYTF